MHPSPFFSWLENEAHGPVKAALLGQQLRCAEQHRRMAVVAAGVHRAGPGRAIGNCPLFRDTQRIHIGTQRYGAISRSMPQRADHPGATDTFGDLVQAELPQLGGNEGRCPLFLETEFRMGVQVMTPRRHLRHKLVDIRVCHPRHTLSNFSAPATSAGARPTSSS